MKSLITIVDGALPAAQHRFLKAAIVGLGGERLIASYQTTFWYELGAPPSTKKLATITSPPAR